MRGVRVWIDLSNSPHPLLFAPIARRLEERGDEVRVTARDHAQTAALARARWPGVEIVGAQSPRSRLGKVLLMADRVRELRRWARRNGLHLALSHNSYGQIVAARSLGLPVVTAMDFEHQPANHLAFRLATKILLPECLAHHDVRLQGARKGKVVRYPGIKEQLYIGDFQPDAGILGRIGISRGANEVLVVARTPPTRAAYHRVVNGLFFDALRAVGAQGHVKCVVLTRFDEEAAAVDSLELENVLVPRQALDSRSLMYVADLVLGAGGTMTREAALLGVPTHSLYAGAPPRVDTWLEHAGRLRRLVDVDSLRELTPRTTPPPPLAELRSAGARIETMFLEALAAARGAPR